MQVIQGWTPFWTFATHLDRWIPVCSWIDLSNWARLPSGIGRIQDWPSAWSAHSHPWYRWRNSNSLYSICNICPKLSGCNRVEKISPMILLFLLACHFDQNVVMINTNNGSSVSIKTYSADGWDQTTTEQKVTTTNNHFISTLTKSLLLFPNDVFMLMKMKDEFLLSSLTGSNRTVSFSPFVFIWFGHLLTLLTIPPIDDRFKPVLSSQILE